MRGALATFLITCCLLGSLAVYTQLVSNSRYLSLSSAVLRDWSTRVQLIEDPAVLLASAREKATLYDDFIRMDHLSEGMVVNRVLAGRMLDQCDSLLFSSLRFVGLHKLGFEERAGEAWSGLEHSKNDSGWLRHPRCTAIGTSRDMLLGLLTALSQEPPGYDRHLQSLFAQIAKSGGYFSTGPVYVSYLTPGLARLMGMLVPPAGFGRIPSIVQQGYATHEFTLYGTKGGYEAHLVALTAWLEMELSARHASVRNRRSSTLESTADALTEPFGGGGIKQQRLEWTTHQLVQLDPHNLFFRYLRLRAGHALSRPVAANLMRELLSMPQFPDDRLPRNCDRKADYLWQRTSREYAASGHSCSKEFHGTDFLWMAGLLTEALEPPAGAEIAH